MPLICVCSPKGGVGKTTLAANLAHGLHRAGRPVLALDLDPQNALRLHFGVPLEESAGFTAQMARRPDWRGTLRRTASGVMLLPYGTLDFASALALDDALERDPELLAAPVREMLADPALVVVADTPPGASRAMSVLMRQADMLLVALLADGGSAATWPEIESGRVFGRGTLGVMLAQRLRFVVNQVDSGSRLSNEVANLLLRRLGPRLLGLIARDEAVAEALANGTTLADYAPGAPAAHDMQELVRMVDAALPAARLAGVVQR